MFLTFNRIIKSGLVNFWRNGWLSTATVLIMTVALVIWTTLFLSNVALTSVLSVLSEKVDISVYFSLDAKEGDILALIDDDAIADKKDVAIGISTSGKAKNVIKAIELANSKGIETIALTGCDGGGLARIAKISIIVPSKSTPRIQESHVAVGHILCQLAEEALF